MWFLVLSVATLLLGPFIYRVARQIPALNKIFDLMVVFSVGLLVLLQILPESLADFGWLALLPLVLGLLGPTLVERWLHEKAQTAHLWTLWIIVVGLSIHSFGDGVALAIPDPDHSTALPLAIIVHQMPAGLVMWWLLFPTHGRVVAGAALALCSLAIMGGYVWGAWLAHYVEGSKFHIFQAFVAGSLLHVCVHALDIHKHEHRQ